MPRHGNKKASVNIIIALLPNLLYEEYRVDILIAIRRKQKIDTKKQ